MPRTLLTIARAWLRRGRGLLGTLGRLRYRGRARYCPVCRRSSRRFQPFGTVPRAEARCVHCGALERHRLLWLFLESRTDLFAGRAKTMLHVAPEACLEPVLRQRLGDSYITADLSDRHVSVTADVTGMPFADGCFDVVYCGHVLEHVPDDRRAMREFHRVLRDDGWAILLVPITAERTVEDPTITSPAERLRLFGQADHVRRYGPDYVERLRAAGFAVQITTADDIAGADDVRRMGLTRASGEIHYCTKR